MNILHISINSPYTEGWGYQENTLLKTQARMGHRVTLIATCQYYNNDASGGIAITSPVTYLNDDNVTIIRVKTDNYFKIKFVSRFANKYGFSFHDIGPLLKKIKPDIIFLHGLGHNITNKDIFSYIKNRKGTCLLFGDSHSIIENDHINNFKQAFLFYCIVRPYLKKNYKLYDEFFYITPECRDFTAVRYGFPKERMTFLPLGYDPFLCDWINRETIRREIREKHGLSQNDIVLIHGGKITKTRKTPEVINAFKKVGNKNLKLVIFGGISNDMQEKIRPLLQSDKDTIYLGNLSKIEYYNWFLASDIGIFPGGQSVLWQESIGCGLPVILGWAKGLDYLDMGGNVRFVDGNSVESIALGINELLLNNKYKDMARISATKGREFFSYERIAKIASGEKE